MEEQPSSAQNAKHDIIEDSTLKSLIFSAHNARNAYDRARKLVNTYQYPQWESVEYHRKSLEGKLNDLIKYVKEGIK